MSHVMTATRQPSVTPNRGRAGWYGAMTPDVVAFFAWLRALPPDAWADIAAREPHRERSVSPLAMLRALHADRVARARLRDVMQTMPEVVQRIRRRVDEILAVLDVVAPHAKATRIRRAVRLAACALAARASLPPGDVTALVRPLREIVSTGVAAGA